MQLEEMTALYSPLDIEYAQEMSGPYVDYSTLQKDFNVIAGMKDGQITGFWRPMVCAGDDQLCNWYVQDLYLESQDITYMDFLLNGRLSGASKFLISKGFKATPIYEQVIPLSIPEAELKANLRKSYKSLVTKGNPTVNPKVWLDIVKQIHGQYGGKLRSAKTWSIQQQMSDGGGGFCVVDSGSYALVYHNKYRAYYASGRGPNNHAAIWYAMLEARKRGCMYFDMGEQVFSGDEKKVNISKFKRGFGGFTQTRLILQKGTT